MKRSNQQTQKIRKLAGYLLGIYYSGAGDAGHENSITSLIQNIGVDENHPNHWKKTLDAGEASTHKGFTTSQYFEDLAIKILNDLETK